MPSVTLEKILENGYVKMEDIIQAAVYSHRIVEEAALAKRDEISARYEWDEVFAKALASGDVYGKNQEERLGVAIGLFPDEWVKYKNAKIALIESQGVNDMNKVVDSALGRCITLMQLAMMSNSMAQAEDTDGENGEDL